MRNVIDPKKLFYDRRFHGICVYCGAKSDTRDHVPSKVLLDEPYPADLPVVPACAACNVGFSRDEPYVACLLDCALVGELPSSQSGRAKVRRILSERPDLAEQVAAARVAQTDGSIAWRADMARVMPIMMKLARGHAAYELAEPQLAEPHSALVVPLLSMSEAERLAFETGDGSNVALWPELGSRAFFRVTAWAGGVFSDDGWQIVQEDRYRYAVDTDATVRIVLSEYLACEVVW